MIKKYLLIFLMLFSGMYAYSQGSIEFLGSPGTGGPNITGPIATPQTATFYINSATPFSPPVTATFSLSNQQFTSVEGITGLAATQFGGAGNPTSNSSLTASPVYTTMNGLGGSTDANYTSCATCPAGTGISTTANYSMWFINIADALITTAGAQNFALNARVRFADITITFSRPVTNPVLHLTGMGGAYTYSTGSGTAQINYDQGFTTEFDLVTQGVTLTRLSGNTAFVVSSTSITNGAARFGGTTTPAPVNGVTRSAASGSVIVNGSNLTSVTLRAFLRGDGGIIVNNNGTPVTATNGNIVRWAAHANFTPGGTTGTLNSVAGDGFLMGLSLPAPPVSGNVFNDPNAGNVNNSILPAGANVIPTGLNAILVDASNNVVSSVPVSVDGSYIFPAVFEGTYTIMISTTAGVQGNAAPAVALPANYVSTGEFNGTPNTGNDGTINGISMAFTVATADITNVNFGIQQRPTAVGIVSAPTLANPGGTLQSGNIASLFSGTDPNGGTIASLTITAFPTGATSIVVNNVTYLPDSPIWPANGGTGLTIPTSTTGVPSQTITVDPIATGVTDVVIPFVVTDNGGAVSAAPANTTVRFNATVSGNVFNDANGGNVNNSTGSANVVPAGINAYLIQNNAIVAVATVATDGTYTFPSAPAGTGYTVSISTTVAAIGATPPAVVLPANYVSTGEFNGAPNTGNDGTINGISAPFAVAAANIADVNFGIDRIPTANPFTTPLQLNPGGSLRVNVVNAYTGSDPEDGTYTTLTNRRVNLASSATGNGNVWYAGNSVPTTGLDIPSFDPTLVTFAPSNGTVTSSFTYRVYDNANVPSPAATVTIPFRLGITIAGTIWNDVNGNANINAATETSNGTTIANIPTLYANIVNASGTVSQSILVTGGTYTSGLVFADSSYTVVLTTTAQTIGNPLSAAVMATGWAPTGVNPGATTGTANTANRTGTLVVSTAGTANIVNRNLGIERIPLANTTTTVAQSNFDPYTQTVASASFGGSDFDGGLVQNILITGFPTNAQTLVVNGTTYGAGFTPFPAGGILIAAPSGVVPPNIIAVKPLNGAPIVVIPYVTIDNANIASVGATVTIPYFTILPVTGLQLTGIRNGNDVVVKWNTLTEQNTSHFIIERSYNGRDFQAIGNTPASGNSNALKSYTITDRNMLKEAVYYRVYLVDADGKKTVSNTVIVRLNSFSISNRVFPNPAKDVIYVELAHAGKYTITLYNAAGQQISVRQVEASSSTLTTINRNNLPAGSYVLKVLNTNAKESESYKLILE